MSWITYVKTEKGTKQFDCEHENIPKKYKNLSAICYDDYNGKVYLENCNGWKICQGNNFPKTPVALIDPQNQKKYLDDWYVLTEIENIFKITSFPNWDIAEKFLEKEKEMEKLKNNINYLEVTIKEKEKEIKELKEKIRKRNRLIRKLRGNCQAIII